MSHFLRYAMASGVAGYLLWRPSGVLGFSQSFVRWPYLFLLGFCLTYVLTPLAGWIGRRCGAVDHPNERKIHTQPVPRIGGLALVISFFVTALSYHAKAIAPHTIGILAGGLIIFTAGLIDDIRGLGAGFRLTAQAAAAGIAIGYGVQVTFMPPGWFGTLVEIVITFVGIIGVLNAFNFLDGLDGLATSLAVIASMSFVMIAWFTNQTGIAYLGAALAGAAGGFLPHNARNAKMFLGDSGSTFLGYMLAILAIGGSWDDKVLMESLSIPMLILGIPIFDMIYTTFSRVKNGLVHSMREWLEYAGKDHFHHRLLNLGMNSFQTLLFVCLVQLTLGCSAVAASRAGPLTATLLICQGMLTFAMIVFLMVAGRSRE